MVKFIADIIGVIEDFGAFILGTVIRGKGSPVAAGVEYAERGEGGK